MRLQRALARAGVASRRRAEDLIRAGRVTVNGEPAVLGMSVDPDRDAIAVGRRRISAPAAVQWLALNKPVGYIASRKGQGTLSSVYELLPRIPGLTYVGRLDAMTSGLMLFTTDGNAVHRLTHPRYGVKRSYEVVVRGRSARQIRRDLADPIVIDDRPVAMSESSVRELGGGRSEMTLVLTEGRYRIVRRLCVELGLEVERLVRTSHGPVALGRLASGKTRRLENKEVRALNALCSKPAPQRRNNGPRT